MVFKTSSFLFLVLVVGVTPLSSLKGQELTRFNELSRDLVSAEEMDFLDMRLSSDEFREGWVISTSDFLSALGEDFIKFSLPGSSEVFMASKVNNEPSYSPYYDEVWMGNTVSDVYGNVLFIRKDQLLSGFIQTREGFYSIVPTGDSKGILMEHKIAPDVDSGCSLDDFAHEDGLLMTAPLCMDPPSNCSATVDVAVLLSDPAIAYLRQLPGASTNPFIPIIFIAVGLESANLALINSGVDNLRFRYTLQRFFFGFFSSQPKNIEQDVRNLAGLSSTQDVRDDLGADLVVMLTNQQYGNDLGIVRSLGPSNASAFAIVEVFVLINPAWIFAHELGHLIGARHNRPENGGNDGTDICSHGLLFDGGELGMKRTVMATTNGLPDVPSGTGIFEFIPGGRLLNYSNPNIIVDGSPTGTASDYNSLTIANTACEVSYFRPDPTFRIDVLVPEEACMEDLVMASVLIFEPNASFPGQPPYTISWNVSASTSQTIFIPVQVSYPQPLNVTATVISSDGVVLSKSKVVNIINCEDPFVPLAGGSGTIRYEAAVNTDSIEELAKPALFPNPATNNLKLLLPAGYLPLKIQAIDANGRALNLPMKPNDFGMDLDVSQLAPGMYYLEVVGEGRIDTLLFIKK